ncbi:hypothetical protein JCM19231_4531 [Vibrio ishigakensis]|uniref:Uncharacterized protein n=1 Tax=Vibrio ishigakensis TaxID=1481914 RepID=A0A0B8NJE4_9VIBR|nr:hypothetical protein [Vibrio ishigakensis]GAM54795.1 hypothetical protein JCM19231_4531 [Vibrio ishigakensis]
MNFIQRLSLSALLISPMAIGGQWTVEIGAFYAFSDTDWSTSSPNGSGSREVDFESDLLLEEKTTLPYFNLSYAFNDRHAIYFDWRRLHRDSSLSLITEAFEITTGGQTYVAQVGADIATSLDFDIYQFNYQYRFYKADQFSSELMLGLHVIDLNLELEGELRLETDAVNGNASIDRNIFSDLTAPLPNLGLGMEYILGPDWLLDAKAQAFYISFDEFSGFLYELGAGVSYSLLDDLSVKASYSYFQIDLDYVSNSRDVDVNYQFHGPMLSLLYDF